MAAIPYPCIDTGYIYDPRKKFDRMMSDFYEAEYSQSYLFRGSISSLPWLLQEYQSDQDLVASKMRSMLMTYLEKYFDSVEVETGVLDNSTTVSYNLRLYIQVTQGAEVINLHEQLKINGTKLEESIKIRE